ncbi:MAG TPA: hypothetical protein VKK31_16615 [Thermoanaerobaculia bacterium]|nr:hypothetical protein [Thermoanaerobaculia bacterium]
MKGIDFSLLVQIAGVVILSVYTFLTWRQVRALVKSNDINRETMILARRSWINVRLSGSFIAASRPSIEIANVGAIPARNVLVGYVLEALDKALLEQTQQPPEIQLSSIGSLGTQDTYSFIPDTEKVLRLYMTVSGLDMKGLVFHFRCQITYDNGFGQQCYTKCGWYFKAPSWIRTFYQLT